MKLNGSGISEYSYAASSGNTNPYVDMATAGPLAGDVFSINSTCAWASNVLDVQASTPGATALGYYQNAGTNGPYVSGVYTPIGSPSTFYASYVEGWGLQRILSRYGGSTIGRLAYFYNLFAAIQTVTGRCGPGEPIVVLDVPPGAPPPTDFLGLRNNPVVTGSATVRLGLAHADRVQVRIYDVTGRLIRTLADRRFTAGEHDLFWDGADDAGRAVSRGVYFTQASYASGFRDAKKLVILK